MKMKSGQSCEILVLQNAWKEDPQKSFRKTFFAFTNEVQMEMSLRDKEQEEKFVEKVRRLIISRDLPSRKAMDEARLDLILESFDGDGQSCALYLLTEWSYEPHINRYLQMLHMRGLYNSLENYQDRYGNNPLHLSATRGHITVSEYLADKYPHMVMSTNAESDLPVEVALKGCHDDVAAFLMRRMSHYSVLELFRASKSNKARINFVEVVRKFTMQKTISAILDAMVIPKWPYPISLHYHNTLIGEWQDMDDQPTHFEIRYDLLDVDQNGRDPHHPEYQYCPKSPFYYITRQCNKSIQKDLLFHPVIKFASERKWQKYAQFWFRFRFLNYCLFIGILASAMLGLVAEPNGSSVKKVGVFMADPINNIQFLWCLVMSLWFLIDEFSEFRREPQQYIRDWTNYWDVSRNVLLITTMFLRFSEEQPTFWYIASLTVFMNAMGIFKYSLVFRFTSSYTRAFGLVIFKDMPRFMLVFMIVTSSFVLSIIISLRHSHPTLTLNKLVKQSGFGLMGTSNGTCSGSNGVHCIWFSILKVWAFGSPLLENSFDFIGPFTSVLVCLLSLTVSVVLFNVLIAQLSHTYEMVQEDSHLSSFVELMNAITTVEFQSRFKIWQVRTKHFLKKEIKTTDEMKEHLQAYKESTGENINHCTNTETKLYQMKNALADLRDKLDKVLEKQNTLDTKPSAY